MKKILLGLGTITAVAAPVAAVVSCGVTYSKDVSLYYEAFMNVTHKAGESDTPKSIDEVTQSISAKAVDYLSGMILLSGEGNVKITLKLTLFDQTTHDASDFSIGSFTVSHNDFKIFKDGKNPYQATQKIKEYITPEFVKKAIKVFNENYADNF